MSTTREERAQQREKLLTAVEQAEGPDACAYTHDTGGQVPACVIGQLLALEGVDPVDMLEIEGESVRAGIEERGFPVMVDNLGQYPISLLGQLQDVWDGNVSVPGEEYHEINVEARRRRMRELVEAEYHEVTDTEEV